MKDIDLVRAAEAKVDVDEIERRYAECSETLEKEVRQFNAVLSGINKIIKAGGLHRKIVIRTPELVELISRLNLKGTHFCEEDISITYTRGTISNVKVKKWFGKPVKAIIFFTLEIVDTDEDCYVEEKIEELDEMAYNF